MNKYKVTITQTEKYIIDVEAKSEEEAREKASTKWNEVADKGLYHYYQEGDTEMETGPVYDVTHTDDPFNP